MAAPWGMVVPPPPVVAAEESKLDENTATSPPAASKSTKIIREQRKSVPASIFETLIRPPSLVGKSPGGGRGRASHQLADPPGHGGESAGVRRPPRIGRSVGGHAAETSPPGSDRKSIYQLIAGSGQAAVP